MIHNHICFVSISKHVKFVNLKKKETSKTNNDILIIPSELKQENPIEFSILPPLVKLIEIQ